MLVAKQADQGGARVDARRARLEDPGRPNVCLAAKPTTSDRALPPVAGSISGTAEEV